MGLSALSSSSIFFFFSWITFRFVIPISTKPTPSTRTFRSFYLLLFQIDPNNKHRQIYLHALRMGIFYGMVARGLVVLAEFSATQSNASVVAKQILNKINQGNQDSNVSFSHDRYIFHVKRTDGLTVLCMADDASGRRIPFAFLEDIHNKFVKTYGRAILSAPAYAMNDEFSRVLSQQMEYYSSDPNADRLNRLKGEMSQVRTVMIDNIEKVLERGDRLSLLVEKTTSMQGNAIRFKRNSRRYNSTLWWRNFRLTVTLIFIFLIIMYIMLAFLCHGPLLTSCWS